jgi:hypothetical protein
MPPSFGTAAAAAAMNIIAATANPVPTLATPMEHDFRFAQRTSSRCSNVLDISLPTLVVSDFTYVESARPTTLHESIIGEIRQWSLLNANWDGEGAAIPNAQSIKEVVSFIRLLDESFPLPEPMLLASGHVALYWNEGSLFADIEFLGDGRIAYFIKSNEDKHKGVLTFVSEKMPPVFQALVRS